MRPGFCKTREELRVSKCILLAYIHSRHVQRLLDPAKRLNIQEFLVTGVFPHDQHLAHCYRRCLQSYNESTNSSHKGTNFGIKFHSCPAWHNGTLASTAMALRLQSDTAIDEMFRYLSTHIEGQAVWQSDGLSNQDNQGLKNQQQLAELTSFASDLVSDQWNRRSQYHC